MPNDLVTIKALAEELNSFLAGGKIEKIYQPEKDEITLAIRSKGQKFTLVISANAQNPRIHLTTIKKENPITAPNFCMHLRKYITSGIIENVAILNNDRIIDIAIISKNELKDTVKLHLVCEMMGRYSNILLINDKKIISDAIKQVSFDQATKRCVLPSAQYKTPEQSKILPTETAKIEELLLNYKGNNIANFLSANIGGLCNLTAEEIVKIAGEENNAPIKNCKNLLNTIINFFNIFNTKNFAPCVSTDENQNAIDYFVCPYKSMQTTFKNCASLSEAIEMLTLKKDIEERHREKAKHLVGAIKKYKSRNQKKLQKANEKLLECDKMDEYKKYGELITSNLYRLKKGDEFLETVDYYTEEQNIIKIPLNPQYSPSKCAQDYFKKYNKLKRTLDVVVEQIDETQADLEYIDTIEATLKNCNSTADLFQIEQELFATGALKKMKTKLPKSVKEGSPILYEYKNHIIAVGKNNFQNDKLTFKTANGGDIWLHALNYHGSHTIIFTEGEMPDDDIINFASEVTAFHSNGATADKIPVDYTMKKYVKRNPNGKLGMVTYTNQKTAYVKPLEHKEYQKQ